MDASGIINYARRIAWGISEGQIDSDDILIMLNKSYRDLYKKIVNLDKNYFWDKWTTDVTEDQFEYMLSKPSGSTYGIFKPENLRIKYVSTDDFINVTFTDWDMLTETPERYAENQSTEEPFAIITDNKFIHIFPTPTVTVVGWLLIEWAKAPYDLTAVSTDEDILIDPLYHEVISYMMCPAIFKEMTLYDKKNDSLQEAEVEIQKALKSMWVLTTKVIRCRRPNLTSLE